MFNGNNDIKDVQKGIKNAFKAVKEEMNVHLETINQNSSEIQSIYEYLNELDSKIEKLNERIDELQMFINPEQEETFAIELTNREQEVFLIIYSETSTISAKEISKKLGFSDEMVNRYVYNMISKGVPLLRQYKDNEVFVSLELKFKELQARKNVLKIDESISKQLLSDKAL
ncbi:MAG: hypothetical protein WC758_00385 [Candidatus Woesearchaeota archaeon]|jgi:DNA-binding NarL/FixJ family response regulator